MSFQKSHIYNVKFLLKSLEANCQRAACKVHALLTIGTRALTQTTSNENSPRWST